MIELELSVQLLIGLATAVFALVVVTTGRVRGPLAAAGAVGLAPLLSWVAAPEFFAVATVLLPLDVRRPAVLLVGVAVLLRYMPVRTERLGPVGERVTAIIAAFLFWAGIAVTTANWIVATGALLPAIASVAGTKPISEASADEAGRRPSRQQDTQQ